MKKHLLFLVCTLVFAFMATANYAQTSGAAKTEFVLSANDVDSSIVMLLPAVQKVREAAARSFASVLSEARTLAAKVKKAGPNMSDSQYQGFQRELQTLGGKLDRIAASMGSTNGPAGCMTECDGAYPGWGGGKGWNRFWCKAACIKIKVGKDGASVGG